MTDQKWAVDFATSALIWARNNIRRVSQQRYQAVYAICARYISEDVMEDIEMGIHPRRALAQSPTGADAFAYFAKAAAVPPSMRGWRPVN